MPNELTSVVLICFTYKFLQVQNLSMQLANRRKTVFHTKKEMQMPKRFQPPRQKKETLHHPFLSPGKHNRRCYIHWKNSIILAPGTTWQMLPRRIHPIVRSQQRQTSMLVPYRSA